MIVMTLKIMRCMIGSQRRDFRTGDKDVTGLKELSVSSLSSGTRPDMGSLLRTRRNLVHI